MFFNCVHPLVSKHGKKTASPRKEESKEGLKSSAANKTGNDASKKVTKPVPASATSTKSTAKLTKASLAPSKQPSVVAAKAGPKPKGASDLSAEKSLPKAGATCKTSAAASKKSANKGKEVANGKPELVPADNTEQTENTEVVFSDQATTKDLDGIQPESVTKQSLQKTEAQSENANGATVTPAADNPQVKQTEGSQSKHCPSGIIPAYTSAGQSHQISSTGSQRDPERPVDTPCSLGSTDTPVEDSWSSIHHQISPESETGSTHTTSSDDIKPRSEDYDAGGSQDDDGGSNDRGVSKCGTMRCHDFLGRSSSDTSTPEELKMYEGGAGLRVEVRLRGREAETTSEEEGLRRRPRSWLQRNEDPVEEDHSEVEATVTVKSVPDHQLFSSEEEDDDDEEDETEDEKSEVEVIPSHAPPPPTEPSPHFQGIVNLAFDDDAVDQDSDQPDYQSTSNFRRSVLLSVDECEELGSEEGSVQTPPQQAGDAVTPCDVFETDPTAQPNHLPCHPKISTKHKANTKEQEGKSSVFLTELQEESKPVQADGGKSNTPPPESDTRDLPHQERPCHLDLRHAEQYNGGPRKNHSHPSENKKADLHLDLNEPQLTGDSAVHGAQSPAGNV